RYFVLAQPEPARQLDIDGARAFTHFEFTCRAPADFHLQAVAIPLLASGCAGGQRDGCGDLNNRHAKAGVLASDTSHRRKAEGRPAVPGVVAPAAAAVRTLGGWLRDLRVSAAWRFLHETVPTPFEDISVHVVEPPRIGLLLADFMRPLLSISAIPGII